MRLNFGKMEIHNFKSFADETFDFSSMSGMTLVCGTNHDIPGQANSAGKSSIFDALLYALFGQLQTNVKNKNLKNRYSGDDGMEISVRFDVDGRRFFRVNRGMNKHGSSFLKVFSIGENGETELTKSSIRETEEFLETEVLHCDVSIFLRTILLSSDQNYNFFLLPLGMKRDFVEKLFNIRIFGEMFNLIHRDILDFEKKFSIKQNALLMLNKSKDDFLSRMEKFESERNAYLEKIELKIDMLKKDLEKLESMKVSVDEGEISKYEDVANKLVEKRVESIAALSKLGISEREAVSKKAKLEAAKAHDEKTVASYGDLLNRLCEKCRPIVLEYYNLDKAVERISKTSKELVAISESLNEIERETSAINEKITKIDSKRAVVDRKIHDMTHESNEISVKIMGLKNEISLNAANLERTRGNKNPYESLYSETMRKIEVENGEVCEMNDKYNYMKMAENIVSQDTLKKFIIKDLVVLLNSRIKYYLMKLGARYTCVFNDDMDYTFITPDDGGETEYATFSAGERMRLSIASSFAFRDFMGTRNGFESNILVLDEFIDSAIDALAVNSVLRILKEFSRINNQHILIISHRKEIDNSTFDNMVLVEKRNNISTISYPPLET